MRTVEQDAAQGAAGSAPAAAAEELLADQGDPPPASKVHQLSLRHLRGTFILENKIQ